MPRKNGRTANGAPLTTAQSLATLVKSARDIMRKDKGLNGDLDRLPMLTWVMFLKFLDGLEHNARTRPSSRANVSGRRSSRPTGGVTGQRIRRRHRRRVTRLYQSRRVHAARWIA